MAQRATTNSPAYERETQHESALEVKQWVWKSRNDDAWNFDGTKVSSQGGDGDGANG